MSVKTDNIQLGMSVTAANNFIFNPDGAGGMKLQRGTIVNGVATPVADILSIDSTGIVTIATPDPWVVSSVTPIPSSGAFANATASIRIKKIGTTVFYKATVDITSIGSVPTSGSVSLALPYTPRSTSAQDEWNGMGRESRITGFPLISFIQSGNPTLVIGIQQTSLNTMASGQRWNASGFYETAS